MYKIKAQYIYITYFTYIIDFGNTVVLSFLRNAYIKDYRCGAEW